MGYTIKQKIGICLKAEANPEMTQSDLALWAMKEYNSERPPSQTTISRILNSKNDIISRKESEFELIRRRKRANPLLRRILTEWITQANWEGIPITTPIIQLTANAIWTRLPKEGQEGNGIFNQKWCSHFVKKLNINITGSPRDVLDNRGYNLNKVWKLDEILELKRYLRDIIDQEDYAPQDVFVIDDFQLFYSLPLDQIFDVSSIDKGIKQSNSSAEHSLTIMLGCNIDGSEKLTPIIVGKYDKFDVSKSTHVSLNSMQFDSVSYQTLMNKLTEVYNIFYKSNTNKWITSSMFQNYLTRLDHKLSNSRPNGRKILIILDDCSSHRIINLKFNNIRLCYLKNEANHKNPYNTTYSGIKFDYLPMNFGIVEEFKILYRLQQYLEMINLQRSKSQIDSDPMIEENLTSTSVATTATALEVLSESDYHISLIRAIEWITRSWHSVSSERIFSSWKKTHLFNLLDWPSGNSGQLVYLNQKLNTFDENKSLKKLKEVMSYLNVVIPWEIDELVGLVNERGKVTLSYASIEEIIDSCLLEPVDDYDEMGDDDGRFDNRKNELGDVSSVPVDNSNDPWFTVSEINEFHNDPFYNNDKSIDAAAEPLELISPDNDSSAIPGLETKALSAISGLGTTSTSVVSDSPLGTTQKYNNISIYPNGSLKHKLGVLENWNRKRGPGQGQGQGQELQNPQGQQQQEQQQQQQHQMSGYNFSPISNIESPIASGGLTNPNVQFGNGAGSFDNQTPLFMNSLTSPPPPPPVPVPVPVPVPSVPSQVPATSFPQDVSSSRAVRAPMSTAAVDVDMATAITKLLEYSASNTLKLSQSTIDDLDYNLRVIRARLNQR